MSEQSARVALVTGANKGIGEAIVKRLERDGYTVFGFDRDAENAANYIHGDVSSEEDWRRAAETIEQRNGRLDVLVNNAGILREARLQDTSAKLWNDVVSVNLFGTFLGCRTMLPLLRKGESAAIVNLSSIDALRGSHGHSAYAASKGGILALTRALALELSSENIRVNAICPGTVDTPMVSHLVHNPSSGSASRLGLHPLNRISTPEDQAAAVAFLAGRDASYITGVSLSVDGGRAIR